MDSRTAAHSLTRIAELLALRKDAGFRVRAYRNAAKAILALDAEDLAPLLRSGEIASLRGIGPATLGVVADLVEHGESSYLRTLMEDAPATLVEVAAIPGVTLPRMRRFHDELGISTLEDLEAAARDGRLATLRGIGPQTAAKILEGITQRRKPGPRMLYHRAHEEAARLVASVRKHPNVLRAEIAGSVRRHREVVTDIDIVAACSGPPEEVALAFASAAAVREVTGDDARSPTLQYVDGTLLHLHCVTPAEFGFALWRATGSEAHVRELAPRVAAAGLAAAGSRARSKRGAPAGVPDEKHFFELLKLPQIPPELREGDGEVSAAAEDRLPVLLRMRDIRGVLHCHSTYSDGTASIEQMAVAARDHGWSYIGISDHSKAAHYAGGLSLEAVVHQHDEIDRLNAHLKGIRVLKGIEADILADGRLDYHDTVLDRFDYVIGSIHSRFKMQGAAMTERVLRAMEDPRLTILAHPTGRQLLSRDPYDLDLDAVMEKAAERGIALELNADPHRLDLDWRYCKLAMERGVTISIGPDAHSIGDLEYMTIGVRLARKAWLGAGDVLNSLDVDALLAREAQRRAGKLAGRRNPT